MKMDNDYQESKLIEAFKIIWDKYPEPAMLINRGKRVMALNWACRQAAPSLKSFCHEIGGCQDINNSCLLNECLDARQARVLRIGDGRKHWTIHWVPLQGYPDYCVHFFAGSGD